MIIVIDSRSPFFTFSEVSCWVPPHFANSNGKHASLMCSGNQTRKLKMPNESMPLPEPDSNETRIDWSGFVRMESVNLQKLLFSEAMLVGVVYCAVRWLTVAGHWDAQTNSNLHTSYIKVPIYIILQTIACIAWIAFAINTTSHEEIVEADANFLCHLSIIIFGNPHRYTVQCVERGEELLRVALQVNFRLCVLVAVTKFSHLVMVFILEPLLVIKSMASTLAEKNINVFQFIFSDLYFSMLARGISRASTKEGKKSQPEMNMPLVS